MDTQLRELIEAIKTEGVQTAEKQAEQIIAAAQEKAQQIVADAESRAKTFAENARSERAKLDQSGREALRQAGRDLILSVQAKLTAMFDSVVATATAEAISADILENSIVTVLNEWAKGKSDPLDVILGEADLKSLENRLRSRLADRLREGAEIRPSAVVKSGFRISTKDGSLYYDFTVESIAAALSAFVGPRLAAILKDAAGSSGPDAGRA